MALSFPAELRYADSHEYAGPSGPSGAGMRLGISAFAVDQLGDIVFVELPAVGDQLERGNRLGTVESVKAVEEIYAPLSGKVLAINQAVIDQPELFQQDPYGAGWLLELSATEPQQFDDLLDAASYSAKLAGAA